MRLYLSCDMEGTAGVCSWSQCDPANRSEYPIYRRYMCREVRAAIDGARESEAVEVTVNDSHWDMRNLLWDELPADVRIISGRKPFSMAEGADRRFDGAFFTGYHGRIGERDAVLAHTYSPSVLYEVRINGIPCSEALLNAALLGHYGTPVLLVSGDRTTVEHVRAHLPWVRAVAVKSAIGYYSADSVTPARAQAMIREAARDAVAQCGAARPFTFAAPYVMELQTAGVEHADFIELLPGFARTGGRTLRYEHADYPTVFRAFLSALRLGAAATAPA